MDAVTLINQNLDVEKLLNHYDFDKVRNDGSMIRSCCKIHSGNNPTAFVINPDNGLWFCHTGDCGGGDAFTLVQKMEDVDFKTAVRRVAEILGIDIANLQIMERKAEYLNELKKWLRLMRNRTKKKEVSEYTLNVPIKEVAKYRNFQESTLRHFGLGWVESIDLITRDEKPYTLHNRLVFPIVQNGVQVGVSLRRVNNSDKPKWSHQPASIETKEMLYNYDAVNGQDKIVVVEGITDVWAYHEIGVTAVATFGAHITDEQYRLLLKTGADLIFSYDGDKAGRLATEKAIKMFQHKANLYVIHFDEGEDPESIPREELLKRYEHRQRTY